MPFCRPKAPTALMSASASQSELASVCEKLEQAEEDRRAADAERDEALERSAAQEKDYRLAMEALRSELARLQEEAATQEECGARTRGDSSRVAGRCRPPGYPARRDPSRWPFCRRR